MVNLSLTPEDIEQLVHETILKSGIGKAVEGAVTKALMTGYNSPVDVAVKDAVAGIISQMLRTDPWDAKIRAAVETALAARVTQETVQKIADEAISKIERAARDSY